jgi:ectoine hydroxylase-related dioxygenase (phytanoyl-CoA dioxygenase family)
MPKLQAAISDETVAAYERDGCVFLPSMFEPHWIELVALGIEHDLRTPGQFFKDSSAEGSAGRYLSDFWAWFHIPEIREYALESPAAAIAARLLRCDEVVFLEDNWFLKEPGASGRTPWHQDQPYYHLTGPMLSVWMPLDPVTKDNGIEFVRGSHRWGKLFIPSNFRTGAPTQDPTGTPYELIPDIEADRGAYDIASWVMEPGDCVAFSATTIHGAPGNPSVERTIRRMSTRWVDKTARYHRRGIEYSDLIGKDRLREDQPVHECADLFPTVSVG